MHSIKTEKTTHEIKSYNLSTNVIPLPVWSDGKCCISVWQLSDDDIAKIVEHRKLYLVVGAEPTPFSHPVVGLSAHPDIYPDDNPIKKILTP